MAARQSASGSVISRNWVKISSFSPRDSIWVPSSSRRWNLALCLGDVFAAACQLVGVVADLLEAHQVAQYQAFALNAFGTVEFFFECFGGLLVELGLFGAESAKDLHLGLVLEGH